MYNVICIHMNIRSRSRSAEGRGLERRVGLPADQQGEGPLVVVIIIITTIVIIITIIIITSKYCYYYFYYYYYYYYYYY